MTLPVVSLCRLSGTVRCGSASGEGFSGDRPCTKWVSASVIDGSSSPSRPRTEANAAQLTWPTLSVLNPPPPCSPLQVPHIREPLSSDHPRVSRHLLRILRRLPRGPHTCTLFGGLSTEATGIQQKGPLHAGKMCSFYLQCVRCHGNIDNEVIRQH